MASTNTWYLRFFSTLAYVYCVLHYLTMEYTIGTVTALSKDQDEGTFHIKDLSKLIIELTYDTMPMILFPVNVTPE